MRSLTYLYLLFLIFFTAATAFSRISPVVYDFSGVGHSVKLKIYEPDLKIFSPEYMEIKLQMAEITFEKEELSQEVISIISDIKDYFENGNDNGLEPQPNSSLVDKGVYTDVSSALFSYLVRQFTDGHIDLELLKVDDNSTALISGVGLGIRPVSNFGIKFIMQETELYNNYGVELGIFPSDNTSIKIKYGEYDNAEKTGLELKLKF